MRVAMKDIPDVVSDEVLEPVVHEPLSQEDVIKLWNAAAKNDNRGNNKVSLALISLFCWHLMLCNTECCIRQL